MMKGVDEGVDSNQLCDGEKWQVRYDEEASEFQDGIE